jgi:hypothetical protein
MARWQDKLNILVTKDATDSVKIFEREAEECESTDECELSNSRLMSIPGNVSRSLDLGGLGTVLNIFIESDIEITVTLNAGSPITVFPRVSIISGQKLPGVLALRTNSVTSIGITNPNSDSLVVAHVTVVLGGLAAAPL